jgi:polysaccharide export outer membrane protein
VIAVKAFDLEDVNQRVRVDGNGNIVLPLLDTVPVAGRTVAQVQDDLTHRLGEYMYKPRVTVFVEEYRSQQVAVLGAVNRPGMISQTSKSATVSDLLSAAGGPTPEAGSRIVLLPVEVRHGAIGALDGSPAGVTSFDDSQLAGALVIDTHETDEQMRRRFLDLPVRAGDLIWVPAAGKFIAEGWVAKPGVYPMTSGLTVRGAIATAGGLSFPASSAIRIYRVGVNGDTQMRQIDFEEVAALRMPDVFLREGDVVSVGSSPVKLPAWAAYRLIADLVHLGMGIKVAP